MRIFVRIFARPVDDELPGPGGPGKRFVFSNDLVLVEYDGVAQNQQRAGTHSGFVTVVRRAGANDNFYPQGSYLLQYEGTYRFNTVPNTPLMGGQVTARGLLYGFVVSRGVLNPIEPPIRFAITGGTDAYVTARGQITEGTPGTPTADDRLLDIQL